MTNATTINWSAVRAAMSEKQAQRTQPVAKPSDVFVRAALCASFHLEEMTTDNEEARTLMSASEVVHDNGVLKWQLKPGERKKILQNAGSLAALRPHLPTGEKTNENQLQRAINHYVKGDARPLQEQNLQELGAAYQVSEWLHELAPNEVPGLLAVESEMKIKELTAPFLKLTEHFQGRAAELKQLREYREWPPLLIHGLGGAGKSTLIAKFILEHLEDSTNGHIPFIYLDFDRPGISVREPLTLLFEGLRQLSLQFPEWVGVLNEYRQRWEEDLLGTEQSQKGSGYGYGENIQQKGSTRSGERRYYMRDFETIWVEILNLGQYPLLFVMDSFEEVQYRATYTDLYELFNFLREMTGLVPQFRAVISGRSELPEEFGVRELFVGPFDEQAASGYLAFKGIRDAALAKRIFSHIGGNPLSLTLAASVVLKELESGDKNHDWLLLKTEGESMQEMLFRRNLEHIHSQEVRKLGFPGLTVRLISPAIVQHVLAGPCGLAGVDENQAVYLFEELKRETFLVNIDEQRRFRFRPDLRKLLIDLVQKQYPGRTRQIHDLAFAFYSKENTPEARAEMVYHALRRGDDPATLSHLVKPDLQPFLENSLTEFTPNGYLFLASVFRLEVPEEVRQRADLGFWEEKMAIELEGLLTQGQVSWFEGMTKRLQEKTDRSPNTPLRYLEASFYELAGDLQRAFEVGKIALRDAEKYLEHKRQGQILELLSRLRARQGDHAGALAYTEQGIAMAKQENMALQAIGMSLDRMYLLRRQGKPHQHLVDELMDYIHEVDDELERLFLQEHSTRKFVPRYNDPVPTLEFLRKHLGRFLPDDVWEEDDFPGNAAQWIGLIVREKMANRWLTAKAFEEMVAKIKGEISAQKRQMAAELDRLEKQALASPEDLALRRQRAGISDLDLLEKHTKARLDVFLREIIPPSVYDIAVYDLVFYTEMAGRVGELTEIKGKTPERETTSAMPPEQSAPEAAPPSEAGSEPPTASAVSPPADDGALLIFTSFVQEDADMKKELDKHLSLLRRTPGIRFWDMSKMLAGMEVQAEIARNLRSAHIILLLISADYIGNDEAYTNELTVALERQQKEGTTVVPVYLRPANLEGTPLAKIQGLPRDQQAVSNFKTRDEAYNEIAVGLKRLVDRMVKA